MVAHQPAAVETGVAGQVQVPSQAFMASHSGAAAAAPVQAARPPAAVAQARQVAQVQPAGLSADEAFLQRLIAPGDELVILGYSDQDPDTDLGMVELKAVKMLGMGGNGAVFLAAVHQLAGSCLQGCLPADCLVVLKFPAQLLFMSAQSSQDSAAEVPLSDATFLLQKEYAAMIQCSQCQHVVKAYGLGTLQPLGKPGTPSIELPVL